MNFKEKLLNHKKMIIGGVVVLLFGTYISYSDMVPTAEYNKLVSQKTEVASEITSTEKVSVTKKEELAKVTVEKETFEKELQEIKTEKREIAAAQQAEDERLEAERLAAAQQAEKDREQQQIVSNNGSSNNGSSNGGSSSSGSSSNGNSGGGSNEVSKPVVDNTTPVAKMVWVTKTGGKYHSHGNCGNSKYVSQVSLSTAEGRGLGPCGTCY